MCAVIEKEVDGELKSHRLIRADTIADVEQCRDASIGKAKQMIDQLGERLF
ncbi:HlyU family transcriptional regulator [Planktotalea frisia]|uniref:HlyU family transcriptional regulator n=1 Tax=Planktotalea frisia TaxID=696762 RepID=UPI0030811893